MKINIEVQVTKKSATIYAKALLEELKYDNTLTNSIALEKVDLALIKDISSDSRQGIRTILILNSMVLNDILKALVRFSASFELIEMIVYLPAAEDAENVSIQHETSFNTKGDIRRCICTY